MMLREEQRWNANRENNYKGRTSHEHLSVQRPHYRDAETGGPGRDRTDDLFHAMEARSQLRHRPTMRRLSPDQFYLALRDSQTSRVRWVGYNRGQDYATSFRLANRA